MPVICVIKHSFGGLILGVTCFYTVASVLMPAMFVIRHSFGSLI